MSPMMASGSDISPPAPRPWKARNAASISIEVEKLDRNEPATKMLMLMMNSGRRPNRSDSLPYSGVVTVAAIRYAVVTPGLLVEAVQIIADGPDRCADDGLVQRAQEHAGHQAVHDEHDLPMVHDRALGGLYRSRALDSGGCHISSYKRKALPFLQQRIFTVAQDCTTANLRERSGQGC